MAGKQDLPAPVVDKMANPCDQYIATTPFARMLVTTFFRNVDEADKECANELNKNEAILECLKKKLETPTWQEGFKSGGMDHLLSKFLNMKGWKEDNPALRLKILALLWCQAANK